MAASTERLIHRREIQGRHSVSRACGVVGASAKRRLQVRGSIVVSISACHAEDPGSIPGRGVCANPPALFGVAAPANPPRAARLGHCGLETSPAAVALLREKRAAKHVAVS